MANSFITVKKSTNAGTVRKHTTKKLNGDTKAAETNKSTKNDINQNNALGNSTAAQDTSNLSDSTLQAFRDTLHYKPLSQCPSEIVDNDNATDHRMAGSDGEPENFAEPLTHNNCVGRADHPLDHRALFQGISLKDFEKHHKLMKEANIEKRRLLSSAIEQRYEMNFCPFLSISLRIKIEFTNYRCQFFFFKFWFHARYAALALNSP